MNLLEFYTSLPTMEQFPMFYVPGYTESLKLYTGVRVVPEPSFLEGLPSQHLKYLRSVPTPYYFIPIIDSNNNCYGYVLKGRDKKTPRFCTGHFMPGYESIKPNSVVCFAEGFKDTYLLKASGYTCLPMLTSMTTAQLLADLESKHCVVVFIPDNDAGQAASIEAFIKKVSRYKIPYYIYRLQGVKDFGDFFLPELRQVSLNNLKSLVKIIKKLEHICQNTSLFELKSQTTPTK